MWRLEPNKNYTEKLLKKYLLSYQLDSGMSRLGPPCKSHGKTFVIESESQQNKLDL